MPLISVIVPVYKVEPYLHRCVDSILAQTFTDFELILVDDGSPDTCGAICDEYAAKDARIHVIHQANGGLSAARNAGIDWAFQNSDSRWLAFIDSDDWVHPRYLELLYSAAAEYKVKVSCCGIQTLQDDHPECPEYDKAEVLDWETYLMKPLLQVSVAVCKLYAKELFDELRYPVGKVHEDEYLTYKLLFLAQKIACFSAELYYYYQRQASITQAPFSLRRLDLIPALEERIDFTKQHGHRPLLVHDLDLFLYVCMRDAARIQQLESLPDDVREHEVRTLRRHVRTILLRYSFLYLPLWENRRYFAFAFPVLGALPKAIYHIFKPPSDQIAP